MSLIFLKIILYFFPIVISTPSCINNKNFCYHCNTLTNLCIKCEYPDIFIPDENGGCVGAKKCLNGKNNCNECDTEGKLCEICEDYYYPDANGGCTYTKGCEISYLGECLKCKEGFILIGNNIKICKSLIVDSFKNCKEINYKTGYCDICDDGYYLTSKDYKCIKTENCKESILGNCISCKDGLYYNKKEDICKSKTGNFSNCKLSLDGKKCEICDEDYYFDENGICIQTQYCSESENLKCKKCMPGYYLLDNFYNKYMCANSENCNNVDKYTSVCTYCNENFYLDLKDYKCKSNLEDGPYKHCKLVDNNGLCKNCDSYYHLGEDYKCSQSYYCSESENGKCLLCPKNYYLGLDNLCTDVEKCIYSKFSICEECEDGYYYNTLTKKCNNATEQFLNCKKTCIYDSDKCCECKNDFYLLENNSLCYDNTKEEPFIKCAIVDYYKEKCNKCIEGYYLGTEDNKCSKVQNCRITENENKCFECEEYYCLDLKNQRCVDNDFLNELNDKIYISCNRTNEKGTACAQCINGYELNEEGYCVDIDICEVKENGKCKKCKDIISENGYGYCSNEIFGCLEHSSIGCLKCDNLLDLYECTECKEGYEFYYNSCRKKE